MRRFSIKFSTLVHLLSGTMIISAQSWLDVTSSHDSSRVLLDEVLIGRTPLGVAAIDSGLHHLRVTPPSISSWSVRDWVREFDAIPGDTIRFDVTLTQAAQTSPSFQFDLRLAVEPVDPNVQFEMKPAIIRSKPIYQENWFRFGLLSVLTGFAGYYYKTVADDAYDQYLTADSPDKMNHYFDRSVKYDKISGALYVACEVNLGLSLYLGVKNGR